MAPRIWGLDLAEIQWWKFKGSYMFNDEYHLRRTKMIVYQIAMILCVVSESVGTAALSDYVDQQNGIQTRLGYHVQNNSIIGTLSFNIFIGISIATIFGSGFFFDLFWPERHESASVRLAWKISSLVVSVMALGDAIALTVIVATKRASIQGLSDREAEYYFRLNGKPNPIYRNNSYCVGSVVMLWPGVVAAFVSTYIMWKSIQHNEQFGPRSSKHNGTKGEEGLIDMPSVAPKPEPVTQRPESTLEPYPGTRRGL